LIRQGNRDWNRSRIGKSSSLSKFEVRAEVWSASKLRSAILAAPVAARLRKTFVSPVDVATWYAYAGDKDRCLEWLARACVVRDPILPFLWFPEFDSVRDDPRFRDLLKRMKLPD
jgi:hypothetical protein